MDVNLIIACALSFIFALAFFPVLIRAAKKRGWVDVPTARRRHKEPVPVVGGIGIFATWAMGVAAYAWLSPAWAQTHALSALVLVGSLGAILAIGVLDDQIGLSPRIKLALEFVVAGLFIYLEPQAHSVCVQVISAAPTWAQIPLWALALIWIVGATNALNLVDGIDGFAGGVSAVGLLTLLVLHSLSGGSNAFMPIALALALPGLFNFLFHNWNPAKIFLGDNGSLTLGFLLAVGGFVPTPPQHAFTMVASLLLLLAFPILDMTLCVLRRFRNGYPIFKADRSHLHHRVQRLGLSVRQTTTLLLLAVAYFQLSSVLIHLVHVRLAALVAGSSAIALFSLLYLIRCIEAWQRENLLIKSPKHFSLDLADDQKFYSAIQVDLRPLLEVGMWEEKTRAEALLASLAMLVQQSIRRDDRLTLADQKLMIYLSGGSKAWNNRSIVEFRVKKLLGDFQKTFRLQYSLDGLPLRSMTLKETMQ